MCGISGFISTLFSNENLVEMNNSLNHRGPDASGYFFDKKSGIGLGHKRLSILDLSEAANQPMTSHCERYIMVYNGEVYNFKEIAKKLNVDNWKTSSDTEVILEAFVKWGIDFVNHLNGMFAIAIFDTIEDKLLLFRDRMGIKPLFYYYDGNNFAFASETKSLLKLPISKIINQKALIDYLHLEYIPTGQSIFKNIYKLQKGSYISYKKDGNIKSRKYFNLSDNFNRFVSKKENFENTLTKSIKYRQISDVPIGAFLSGGNDSSMICSLYQKINTKPINTFNIGFEEKKFDESRYASEVAEILKTNHRKNILKNKINVNEIISIIEKYDEPFSAPSIIPTYRVCKNAQKYTKVVMSGDGGDELFMGYGYYNWFNRINTIKNKSGKLGLSTTKRILKLGGNRYKRASRILDANHSPSLNWVHIWSQEQYMFSIKEIKSLLNISYEINSSLEYEWENVNKLNISNFEKISLFDLENYIPDNLLYKMDIASMSNSIEVRTPFLDHHFVNYSLNLNQEHKINKGIKKYILKKNLEKYINSKLVHRTKWGFPSPIKNWLLNELKPLVDIYLSRKVLEKQGIFNFNDIEIFKNNFYNKKQYFNDKRIWTILVFQIWYNKYIEEL